MGRYLLNTWYAAARGDEVRDAPLGRTLLDRPVALYRDTAGAVVALEDRCPHRFAPLSRGKIRGDALECGYHGMRFNRSGACSHNPHGPIPPRARVRSYPTLERYGYIWFWPGDPGSASPERLPEFEFLDRTDRFTIMPGYLHVKANYQLIVDNLLDLSHAHYIHPHFAIEGLSVEEQLSVTKTKTTRSGDTVIAWRSRTAVPPNPGTREVFGFGPEPVDTRSHMKWHPPALLDFDVGACLTGTPEESGLCIPQAHFITPETALTSHYFFAASRNMKRDDLEAGQRFFELLDLAFRLQDEPMIEAVQHHIGAVTEIEELNPLLLRIDAAPIMARRVLQRLIAAEQGGRTAAGADFDDTPAVDVTLA